MNRVYVGYLARQRAKNNEVSKIILEFNFHSQIIDFKNSSALNEVGGMSVSCCFSDSCSERLLYSAFLLIVAANVCVFFLYCLSQEGAMGFAVMHLYKSWEFPFIRLKYLALSERIYIIILIKHKINVVVG